jgi:hypothetical protein
MNRSRPLEELWERRRERACRQREIANAGHESTKIDGRAIDRRTASHTENE